MTSLAEGLPDDQVPDYETAEWLMKFAHCSAHAYNPESNISPMKLIYDAGMTARSKDASALAKRFTFVD